MYTVVLNYVRLGWELNSIDFLNDCKWGPHNLMNVIKFVSVLQQITNLFKYNCYHFYNHEIIFTMWQHCCINYQHKPMLHQVTAMIKLGLFPLLYQTTEKMHHILFVAPSNGLVQVAFNLKKKNNYHGNCHSKNFSICANESKVYLCNERNSCWRKIILIF